MNNPWFVLLRNLMPGEEAWRCRGCGGYVPLSQRLYRTTSEAWHSSCFRCSLDLSEQLFFLG
ncbi:hypothetical protein A6R68_16536 [Neotoma lepida]|uniref:LIM zinc-binding domain-containing protein n=1 Tax=Neotoma lepida TaxID=56216 RepID=A0A1A6HFI8_NEOLE|nr:hypothetical protein A6R68_16536 [Neotoma lepida]